MLNKKILLLISTAFLLISCSNSKDVDHKWVVKDKAPEEFNLSTDALFKFAKSNLNSLNPEGKSSLDNLVDKLNNGYVSIKSIELIGHTDRIGSENANYKLGLNRANTVKAYLESNGIKAPITASSVGETQPITTQCVGQKKAKKLVDCLQPDRRVTIKIDGLKKNK